VWTARRRTGSTLPQRDESGSKANTEWSQTTQSTMPCEGKIPAQPHI
jgi:hypothetical protein